MRRSEFAASSCKSILSLVSRAEGGEKERGTAVHS